MRFVDRDHMIQQFPTATSYPTLGHPVLPRTTNRRPHSLDVHRPNGGEDLGAVLGIVIEQKKPGERFVGEGLPQLLHDPGTRGCVTR